MTSSQQFMFLFNAFILFSLLYFVQNGLLQDQNGCEKVKCAVNQTCTTKCVPTCRPSCKEPNPTCDPVCIISMDGTNCVCNEDYVIGPKKNCIKLTDCPPPTCKGVSCGKNRTCTVCEPTCYPTCDDPNVPCTKICRRVASKTFCPCSAGFVIGPKGNCILQKDCPAKIGFTSASPLCTSDDQCCGKKKCCGPPVVREGDISHCTNSVVCPIG